MQLRDLLIWLWVSGSYGRSLAISGDPKHKPEILSVSCVGIFILFEGTTSSKAQGWPQEDDCYPPDVTQLAVSESAALQPWGTEFCQLREAGRVLQPSNDSGAWLPSGTLQMRASWAAQKRLRPARLCGETETRELPRSLTSYELCGKDALLHIESCEGCAVWSRLSAFLTPPHAGMGLGNTAVFGVISAPISNPSPVVLLAAQ